MGVEDGKAAQQFFLVHIQTLVELAEAAGFELVELDNLSNLYQDHAASALDLLREEGVVSDASPAVGEAAMELFVLHASFVFRRRGEA
mmetsp:Transcript_89821/g.239996  ORF Transcript_89821/g.239996 Transcript_89821/m.239996 type:complete len:88 (-) Transcript_89821:182-445(-)